MIVLPLFLGFGWLLALQAREELRILRVRLDFTANNVFPPNSATLRYRPNPQHPVISHD